MTPFDSHNIMLLGEQMGATIDQLERDKCMDYAWPRSKFCDWHYKYRDGNPCRTRDDGITQTLETPYCEFGGHRKRDRAFMEGEQWPNLDALHIKQYGNIVEYDGLQEVPVEVTGVGFEPTRAFVFNRICPKPSTWRRFTMWFKNKKVVALESKVSSLRTDVSILERKLGSSSRGGYWMSYPPSAFNDIHDLRRDLDLLLKKHKLCIDHQPAGVRLIPCGNKSGGKRGNK